MTVASPRMPPAESDTATADKSRDRDLRVAEAGAFDMIAILVIMTRKLVSHDQTHVKDPRHPACLGGLGG
ncbi:MAG: hypothetical protein EBS42_11595 [Caulobacteraceae bacterium]|nr:hypothetical protein [Caulobacteraceae bacterium]